MLIILDVYFTQESFLDLLLHGVDGDGLPVDALRNFDGGHGGQAGSRQGHEQLQAHGL